MKNPTAKAKLINRGTATREQNIPSTGSPNPAPRPGNKMSAFAALLLAAALCAGCVGRTVNSVNSVYRGSTKLKPFNFTAFANNMGKKHALEYFNSYKVLSLAPTGGRIVWEDYYLRQKHVATYSGASRYILSGHAGGATGLPSTRVFFPLLYTNSAATCHYYVELFDSYYSDVYEQQLVIYCGEHKDVYNSMPGTGRIYGMFISLPMRGIDRRNLVRVVRTRADREGVPYYLVTRIEFLKDLVVATGNKKKKLIKIHRGSYITFQNRSFFKAYRGVFAN
ncbi:MAG: hypothetical protein KA369_03065 [Spirochaetes bacterium]|nr:hypothetical protein [Spirochaetota bacterium]